LGANDVLLIGGNLSDCLAQVANGDQLIIITHGWDNGTKFRWGGMEYTGFGNGPGQGTNPHPVPPGFGSLMNVTVEFCACWSKQDPDGAGGTDRPLTHKIVDAMGGDDNGHTADGFMDIAWAQACIRIDLAGGTERDQQAAAALVVACLEANDKPWLENPPANRPGTGTPQNPNQQSAAQAIVDACPGLPAGVTATVVIPDAVVGQNQMYGYKTPVNMARSPGLSSAGTGCCACSLGNGCGCGDAGIAANIPSWCSRCSPRAP
jgi:hypothetical protein